MISVLINAYAVSPDHGSEQGMGWNWIINIAKYCTVHIITEGEWRRNIEEALNEIPYKNRMKFYYIPVSEKIRQMCWNQGDWRFYYYYHNWQKLALKKAKDICKNTQISIIHQLNMIGYREPGLLWRIRDIPTVWGPVGGFGSIPYNFSKEYGLKFVAKQTIKNLINKVQIYQPNVYRAIKSSTLILAATKEAQISLQNFRNDSVVLLNETGSDTKIEQDRDFNSHILRIIWVGKHDPRKALPLALDTMRNLKDFKIELHIIGVDKSTVNPFLLDGLKDVYFYSWIPHNEVQEYFKKCHILLFTSLHEGTPHVVIEALSNGLPVVCHDICGQGDVVNETCGIKVPMINPRQSVEEFTNALLMLYKNRDLLSQLSCGAYRCAREISWEKKTQVLISYYDKLTGV